MADARAPKRDTTPALAAIISGSLFFGGQTSLQAGVRPTKSPQAEAAGKLHQCAACHGDNGVSTAEIFPNLAAQTKEYTAVQLTAFRDHTRQDRNAKTYMWGMASGLSDATIQQLAAIYSAKPPAPSAREGKAEVAAGETIFRNGVAAHGVLACVSCHGLNGEGNAVIPRLAGQHKDYLVVQLKALASGSRDNAIMHPIAMAMSRQEIKAVATYLASR